MWFPFERLVGYALNVDPWSTMCNIAKDDVQRDCIQLW